MDFDAIKFITRISDEELGQTFEGMAEAPTLAAAHLRALAEAYERLCITAFQSKNADLKSAHGLGVGFRKRFAELRAWGEYWERSLFCDGKFEFPNEPVNLTRETPVGRVHLGALRAAGYEGSGYGLTKREAIESALKSARRKRDFNLKPVRLPTVILPQVVRITLTRDPWLECFFVGNIT